VASWLHDTIAQSVPSAVVFDNSRNDCNDDEPNRALIGRLEAQLRA
jgi:hypothetical protein